VNIFGVTGEAVVFMLEKSTLFANEDKKQITGENESFLG
jgi:hypothetical protein